MKGVEYTYNMNFDSAQIIFSEVIRRYPEHPAGYFLTGLNYWWRIQRDPENIRFDRKFIGCMDTVLLMCRRIEGKEGKHQETDFFGLASNGFLGRHYANREEWTKAANYGISAYRILKKKRSEADYPVEFLFAEAAYNYYAVIIPERYPVVRPFMIFFSKPDKNLGMKQFEKVYREAYYTRFEALYFLVSLYLEYENYFLPGLDYVREAHRLFPRNSYFHLAYARYCFLSGNDRLALDLLLEIRDRARNRKGTYGVHELRDACYYLGRVFQAGGDQARSMQYYEESIRESGFLNYEYDHIKHLALLHKGFIHDLLGQRLDALKSYTEVIKFCHNDITVRQAEKYRSHIFSINKYRL